jgi:hypothetical protein
VFVLSLPNTPAKAIDNASQSFHRARAVYTPRLLIELDEHFQSVQRKAEEQAAPKASLSAPLAHPPAADIPPATVIAAPPVPPPAAVQLIARVAPPALAPTPALVSHAAPILAAAPNPAHAHAPAAAAAAPILPQPAPGPAHVAVTIPAPAPAQYKSPAHPAPVPAPVAANTAAVAADPGAFIHLAIAQVRDVLPDIERAYLERFVRAFLPRLPIVRGNYVGSVSLSVFRRSVAWTHC